MSSQAERIAEKKVKFLKYFKDLPIQKLAAGYIGVSEDTVSRWKGQDKDFADDVSRVKSEWALEKVKGVRSREWVLERVMKGHFAPRKEVTGADGEPIELIIMDYRDANKTGIPEKTK